MYAVKRNEVSGEEGGEEEEEEEEEEKRGEERLTITLNSLNSRAVGKHSQSSMMRNSNKKGTSLNKAMCLPAGCSDKSRLRTGI